MIPLRRYHPGLLCVAPHAHMFALFETSCSLFNLYCRLAAWLCSKVYPLIGSTARGRLTCLLADARMCVLSCMVYLTASIVYFNIFPLRCPGTYKVAVNMHTYANTAYDIVPAGV